MTRLEYGVEPREIAYSRQGADSIVDLLVSATNRSLEPVACKRILLSIPAGEGNDALTADPRLICGAPGRRTPWAVGIAGDQRWGATPLPPVVNVAPGQRIEFLLANIVVNRTPGDPRITIEEHTEEVRTAYATVYKTEPTDADGEVPEIIEFVADLTQVALGANTTLRWRVAHATSGSLEPEGIVLDRDGITQGSVTLPVSESMTFTLRAIGTGGSSQAPVAVAVMPVEILLFEARPQETSPGKAVTLTWFASFAVECSIDQGVGPVPPTGQYQVNPSRTTIYTLRADGLNPQTRAVTVTVPPIPPP